LPRILRSMPMPVMIPPLIARADRRSERVLDGNSK
jgi:hypothetical protein